MKIQNIQVNSVNLQQFTVNPQTEEQQPLKLSIFHPVMKLSNLEPFCLSFTYNGGMDLHLQINS